MAKLALAGLFLVFVCPKEVMAHETCTQGMIQPPEYPLKDGDEPRCPPAICVDACVGIPASSKKTGETLSVYPDPGKAFAYSLNREGSIEAIQKYCYTLKNWGNEQLRSYSLCVQYKDQ